MKQRTGRLLATILTLILLSGCGGNSMPVTGPEISAPQAETKQEVSVEPESIPDASEGLLIQGPALRLGHDDIFEIYERTAGAGISYQNYWTNLPYESHCKSMLSYYVETHLIEEAGLTLLRQDETEIEGQMLSILFFTHPEAEIIPETDYCLMLAFCEADDGGTEIRIDYSDSLTLEEWEANAQAVSEPEPEPEPAPAKDPTVLPDFLEMGTDYKVSRNTTSHWRIYRAEHMDIGAVETYIQELLDMGYTIVHTEEESNSFDGVDRCWEFVHADVDADAINTRGAQVTVESSTYGEWDDQTLDIEFSDEISMGADDSVSSEPSSTGGGYVDCPSCSGGNCTACNGRRGEYSYSPGLDREWEECWKCRGTGKCSKCKGSGQIFG